MNHDLAEFRIEGAEWLVHQKAFRPPDDRPAKGDTLPVAAGKPRDGTVEDMADLQEPRSLFDALTDFRPGHALG
ncbi:hypothetical protein D3C87_2052110 [compost metagenome]